MKNFFRHLSYLSLLLAVQLSVNANPIVGDTILLPRIITPPFIDGSGSDACWDSAAWNPMPYAWKPYGEIVDSSDLYGRFKVVWSKEQNLLYFLFEITDDIFVNGYEFRIDNGSYPNYDVVEIFIDEDHSGGMHSIDNNAFAYHITSGNATSYFDVVDIWPDWDWSHNRVNYKDHFPEFKRANTGNVYTWEFSLMVLTDAFTADLPPSGFKSALFAGKEMGLSAAYCDNDNSDVNPVRDHFFGSKYLKEADADESWQNASLLGYMKLVNEPTANPGLSVISENPYELQVNIFPNPFTDLASISFTNQYIGEVKISLFNTSGQLIKQKNTIKSQSKFEEIIDFSIVMPGIYVLKIETKKNQTYIKIITTEE
jgi:hypothetical protein